MPLFSRAVSRSVEIRDLEYDIVLTAFLLSALFGLNSKFIVASALRVSNFVRFLSPSSASPPRLWARFFRLAVVGAEVEVDGFKVEGFSLFGKREFDVEEPARADRDARARFG